MPRRPNAPACLLLPTLLAFAAACGSPDEQPEVLFSQRDSAGVTVVENADPAQAPRWSIAPQPALSVGGMDAPEEEQLYLVSGGVRLADGRIAFTNAGTREVRILDAQGVLLATHGREGDGPGEFRTMELQGTLGADTLLVWDQTSQRVSLVHPDGGVGRTYPVSWTGTGFPMARGVLDDGSLVVGGGMSFSSEEGFPTGVIRPASTFGWVRPDGEEIHVGDFPAAEMFARANEQGFMALGLPFGRFSTAAAAPDGLWVGTGEAYEVRFYGVDGTLARIARTAAPRRPVTGPDVEAHIQAELEREAADENRRRELQAMIREMPIPDFMPPYQGLVVDTGGNLWVEDYVPPQSDAAGWTVFDAQGRLLARVDAPPRTQILEIGEDYLLGRTRDEFDVESLTLWTLVRARP